MREDIIYGRNPVMEAIRSGRDINKIFIANDLKDNIFSIAREQNIIVIKVDRRKLDKITGSENHQGIAASISPHRYYELDEILSDAASKDEEPFLMLLDELTDDNNLANIIRTANAFGVHGIIIPKRNSASLNAVVAKRSAGAIEYVKVARVTNLGRTIDELKQQKFWVYCADSKAKDEIQDIRFDGPVAVVIGSEGYGVGKLVRDKCDYMISIPIKGRVSSINAASAAAVIAYEISKQRTKK